MTSADTPPATPPTAPGRLGRVGAKPVSRWAVSSLVCGIVGLLPTPATLAAAPAAIVLGIVGLRRLAAPDNARSGGGLALAGICTGACGVVLAAVYATLTLSIIAALHQAPRMEAIQDLRRIHDEAVQFSETSGRYPVHPAELIVDSQRVFRADRRVGDHAGGAESQVKIGSYDFAGYDGTARGNRAVVAALEGIDESETIYRFGAFWFVRLDRPRYDADIVFAWWPQPESESVTVITDDGTLRDVRADGWGPLWAVDAAARKAAGLDPLPETPPFPPRSGG